MAWSVDTAVPQLTTPQTPDTGTIQYHRGVLVKTIRGYMSHDTTFCLNYWNPPLPKA